MLRLKQLFTKLIITLLLAISSNANTASELVFNTTGQPPLNRITGDGFMDDVTREALSRLGYTLTVNRLPAERALRLVNSGIIDGEMSRIKGLDLTYPNLVRVPEKIMDWEFVIYSKKTIDLNNGWNSLNNKSIAFITGWKILEKNTPKSAKITKTKNARQLFTFLEKDRTDYIIYEKWGGKFIINKQGIDNVNLQLPPLAKKEMYIYLHKKHTPLVSNLSTALKDMKKDGSYQKLVDKHLTSLLKKN